MIVLEQKLGLLLFVAYGHFTASLANVRFIAVWARANFMLRSAPVCVTPVLAHVLSFVVLAHVHVLNCCKGAFMVVWANVRSNAIFAYVRFSWMIFAKGARNPH